MAQINAERLLSDLRILSEIGRYKTGVHRPSLSAPDLEARAWLVEKMTEAGLAPRIDGIGNVVGYSKAEKRILVGSHIESQPQAGRLDGALGILYGLEVARTFKGQSYGIDLGAWFDEEGFYGAMLGSRSFCDRLPEAEFTAARHRDNNTLLSADLAKAGYAGRSFERIDSSRYLAYCEAHIEQGDWLEANGKSIGLVSGIVGLWSFSIEAHGIQNHAGTTRMAIRKDAGLALCKLVAAIDQEFPKVAGPHSVWTTGKMEFDPGAHTIIPGKAAMHFHFRDTDLSILAAMEAKLMTLIADLNAQGSCQISYSRSVVEPVPMAPQITAAFAQAAIEIAPDLAISMPSHAGHDANIFGQVMPSAMLFVPSIGGISHHYTENTKDEDIVLGCQIFAKGLERLLTQ